MKPDHVLTRQQCNSTQMGMDGPPRAPAIMGTRFDFFLGTITPLSMTSVPGGITVATRDEVVKVFPSDVKLELPRVS